jgi:regulator of sigma E protease
MLQYFLLILPSCIFATIITLTLFNIQKFFHELGHLIMAKRAGVRVEEFGIGYRPRAFKIRQSKNTLYTFNWLPFGSFIKMAGEEDPSISDGFVGKSKRTRFAILIIGPVLSLLILGLCLTPSILSFSFANMAGAPEAVTGVNINGEKAPLAQTIITEVLEDTPAAEAGLQIGDVIVGADGVEFNYVGDMVAYIERNKGTEIVLHLQRVGQEIDTSIIPRANPPKDQGALGVGFKYQGVQMEIIRYPLHIALIKGARSTFQYIGFTFYAPFAVAVGNMPAEAMRPMGVGEAYQSLETMNDNLNTPTSQQFRFFWFAGVLSVLFAFPLVILTVISLLPLPGWDSWRMLSLIKR